MKRKLISGICLSLAIVGGSIYTITQHPFVQHTQTSYAKILSDNEATSEANDIIIGRIVKNLKSYEFDGKIVRTDSLIHVEKTLKGNLTGDIIFSQEGGQTKNNGYVIFDNYNILKPGPQYLLFLDNFPADYVQEYPEQADKFLSVGGPYTVYKVEGKQAKNAIKSSRDRDFDEFVKEITDKLSKS